MDGAGKPARFEIRVEEVLDGRWEAWFEALQITRDGRQPVISGPFADQAALHGLLVKVRDLGLGLVAVRRLDPDDTGTDWLRGQRSGRDGRI